ncbi:MAG: hypothetical protein KF708_11305 [Pirellulales bacterium]|nr:hypothetical protein [Pirellulales bacterium]
MFGTRPHESVPNYFRLVVHGKEFDVDKFVERYPLPNVQVWHRGDKTDREQRETSNGFAIPLGSGPELHVDEQQQIAIDFLAAYTATLKKAARARGVTHCYLGLQEIVYPNTAGSIFDLSPTLLKHSLNIGLQVTVWSCLSPRPFRSRVKSTPRVRKTTRAKPSPKPGTP